MPGNPYKGREALLDVVTAELGRPRLWSWSGSCKCSGPSYLELELVSPKRPLRVEYVSGLASSDPLCVRSCATLHMILFSSLPLVSSST